VEPTPAPLILVISGSAQIEPGTYRSVDRNCDHYKEEALSA
jgi:hypothetical protein